MLYKKIIRSAALASCLALMTMFSNHARAVDDTTSTSSVDLTSVRTKIAAKDYKAAIAELRDLAQDNQDADVYSLLAFSLRKSGDFQTSLTYYNMALQLQPNFKPAREYLGELYLDMGELNNAKIQLATLEQLCPTGCEERTDLQQAINAKSVQ